MVSIIHGPWEAAAGDARAYLIRIMPSRAYLFERMGKAELEELKAKAQAIAIAATSDMEAAYQDHRAYMSDGDKYLKAVACTECASEMADLLHAGDSLQTLYEKSLAAMVTDRIERGLFG